jgi:predicted nuclease with TOPRIM domain
LQQKIGTANSIVVESIKTGIPKGYENSDSTRPKTDADLLNDELRKKLDEVTAENTSLKKRVEELELQLQQYQHENVSKSKSNLAAAMLTDAVVNGDDQA